MEVSMSEIIREARNAINSRLDMLEILIHTKSTPMSNSGCDNHRMEYKYKAMDDKINNLYEMFNTIQNKDCYCDMPPLTSVSEKIPEIIINETDKPILTVRSHNENDDEDSHVKRTCDVEEESEAEEVAEESEAEEVAEEESEAEAEEQLELEEFEYKGMTLYRDSESKVYQMDEDGALSDPIGIWDETKNRIKKI